MTAAENYMQPFWERRKEDLITAFTVVEQRLGDLALKAMDQLILPIEAAMESVIGGDYIAHTHMTPQEIAIRNSEKAEQRQRLKAMVGVLEKGSSPSAVDAPAQGHEADNRDESAHPKEEEQ